MDFILQCIFREARQKLEAQTMEECGVLFCFQAHLQLPFYIGQAHSPRDGTTHGGLGPSKSISSLENVP